MLEDTVNQWEILRQDDNGNKFIIQSNLAKEEADRLVAIYETKGHKQMYWSQRMEQYNQKKR